MPVVLPAFPKSGDLVEFDGANPGSNRYFIDGKSIAIVEPDEIRFTLVVRSAGGAENVSYHGLHCAQRIYALFATGQRDEQWSRVREVRWQELDFRLQNRHLTSLAREYFCDAGIVVRTPKLALESLRRGGLGARLAPR